MVNMRGLSLSKIKLYVDLSKDKNIIKHWNGNEIVIREMIPMEEYAEMIDDIIQGCTDPTGVTIPVMVDFAIRANVISKYSEVELPDDVSELYRFVYKSGIYELICESANKGQVGTVKDTVLFFLK